MSSQEITDENSSKGSEEDLSHSQEDAPQEDTTVKKTGFFSEVSMNEFAFGLGIAGVNCLCVGMMLNIPTAKLHELMYQVAPQGLLVKDLPDDERVNASRAIVMHWYTRTKSLKPKKRFRQLVDAFKYLREKKIVGELTAKYEKDEPISFSIFQTFDLGRVGPYVPPETLEVEPGVDEEEEYWE